MFVELSSGKASVEQVALGEQIIAALVPVQEVGVSKQLEILRKFDPELKVYRTPWQAALLVDGFKFSYVIPTYVGDVHTLLAHS